ncbi:MAG: hypothetical protein U9P49_14155 [Thermodesulfobacteriota bacterium]|nr:hypothetical protein [Thermodesulfobacteriota bacterium]
MKNLSKYSMWLVMILAIGLFANGCGGSPGIYATDGVLDPENPSNTQIVVTWTWDGGLGDSLAAYVLERATSPYGPFTAVTTALIPKGSETWTDTVGGDIVADTAYFYRVTPYTAENAAGTTSYVNGGMAGDTGQPTDLRDCGVLWSRADQCYHENVNKRIPAPSPPEFEEWNGSITGSTDGGIVLSTTYGLEAVATFNFYDHLLDGTPSSPGYEDQCTNGFAMLGQQVAPLKVADFSGRLTGLVEFIETAGDCDGYVLYDLEVMQKQSVGGNYYLSSDGITWYCYNYAPDFVTIDCTCDTCTGETATGEDCCVADEACN